MILNDEDETLEYWYTSWNSSTLVVLTINEPYIESGNHWGWDRLTPINYIPKYKEKKRLLKLRPSILINHGNSQAIINLHDVAPPGRALAEIY